MSGSFSGAGSVVVVGSVTADLTAFSARPPASGETVLGDDFTLVLGGKGANQAVSAAMAGAIVHIVACVGSDIFSDLVSGSLSEHGVRTDYLTPVDGPTGIAHIRVDSSGENNIVVVPLANSKIATSHVDSAFAGIEGPSVLLTQLEVPSEVAEYAIKKGSRSGLTVILDPAPARVLNDSVWPCVDIVTPNETEARILTGIEVVDRESALQAGRWFNERGVKWAIITMAAEGALLVSASSSEWFEPLVVDVVDTTAAGDAFAGYLGACLALGSTLQAAVAHAIVAGGLAVTKRGASTSIPAREEVDTAINRTAWRRSQSQVAGSQEASKSCH